MLRLIKHEESNGDVRVKALDLLRFKITLRVEFQTISSRHQQRAAWKKIFEPTIFISRA